jgi:hypothetical protein
MRWRFVTPLVMLLAGSALVPRDAGGESPAPAVDASATDATASMMRLTQPAAALSRALHDYRDSLERLLAIHEQALRGLEAKQPAWQDLHARGVVSRRELEQQEAALAAARTRVDAVRRQTDAADHAIAEAMAMESLAALPPPAISPPPPVATPARHEGPAVWSLSSIAPRLDRMFVARFGRVLPISALGQTPLHDRMGFDHRDALDVAVHPDSAEGRALIEYLQAEAIPFIAYRGAVPGAASGAHIHVGQPSPRIAVLTHSDPRRP